MTTPHPAILALAVFVTAAGCTRERWDCEACVKADPSKCATSASYGRTTEESARCDAAEGVCIQLDQATFDRECRQGLGAPTTCAPEQFPALSMTCAAKSELTLPLGGVR